MKRTKVFIVFEMSPIDTGIIVLSAFTTKAKAKAYIKARMKQCVSKLEHGIMERTLDEVLL